MPDTDNQFESGQRQDAGQRLRDLIALHEELRLQTELYAEESGEAFEGVAEYAGSYASHMERANRALDVESMTVYGEVMQGVMETTETASRTISGSLGRLLSKEMWNPDAVVRWDRALVGVAQHLTTQLVTGLLTYAARQVMAAVATKAGTVANLAYAASVNQIARAYFTLAAARAASKAVPGAGMLVHEGGAIYHAGGAVRMHSGGLKPDERPAILQRGEYVIRRSAASNLGLLSLDYMNKTGTVPRTATGRPVSVSNHFSIQVLDATDLQRVVSDKIVPILEREQRRGWYAPDERS